MSLRNPRTTASSDAPVNGPFVIGYTLCFGLMGALAVQACVYTLAFSHKPHDVSHGLTIFSDIYFTRFTDDRRAIKTFVTIVLLLETLLTGAVFVDFWISSTNGLVLESAASPTASFGLAPITGLVTTLTHGFFCWRIYSLRKFRLLSLPIMMVSLLQLASIIYFALTNGLIPSQDTYTNISPSDYQISSKLDPWLVIWLGSSVVCDLAITICMILCLRPSDSHFRSNKSIMVKLTRLTIETGLVTTVAALLELILGLAFQNTYYHIAVFYAISKLYANCLLASLNFRLVLRSQSDPNLTEILWDNGALNTQPSQVTRTLARRVVESGVHVVADLNGIGPRKNSFTEDQTCEPERINLLTSQDACKQGDTNATRNLCPDV
ncbi:hypothetical protein HD554DRAFT_2318046 [Boletus coccyginus]|nr:hypothetical protein HD554DRAFT_2318046 [Boletus coccyginus]